MERTVVILGGGLDQVFMIRTAQEMGLRTLTLDMNQNAPGFNISDDSAVISTRDIPTICAFLDEYSKTNNIVGVSTMGSDIPDIVAEVAHHLGTSSISKEAASLAVNKFEMKKCFAEHNVRIPRFTLVSNSDEVRNLFNEYGDILIIKPIDRAGSRGVSILRKDDDIDDLFQNAKDAAFSGLVQVEEYLPGKQLSTESIMSEGKIYTVGYADRNYEHMEKFWPQIMENGGWVPSLLEPHRQAVDEMVERAALALGITDGVVKGDVVMTPKGPAIIEIAARLSGGDFSESLVPLGTGVNYVKTVLEMAIGDPIDWEGLKPTKNLAVANRYFFAEPGILISYEGIDEVMSQEWVKKVELWRKPGDIFEKISSHGERLGVFVIVGQNREQVQERIDWVYDKVKIRVE